MFNALYAPGKAIESAKTEKSIPKAVGVLLVGFLFIIAALFVILLKNKFDGYDFRFFRGIFFFYICLVLMGFAFALLINIILGILGKTTGGFFDSLAIIGMGVYVGGCALFLSSIIMYLMPKGGFLGTSDIALEFAGYIIVLIMMLYLCVLLIGVGWAYALMMKAAKELFGVDIFTAFIVMSIINTISIVVIYSLFVTLMVGMIGTLGVLGSGLLKSKMM